MVRSQNVGRGRSAQYFPQAWGLEELVAPSWCCPLVLFFIHGHAIIERKLLIIFGLFRKELLLYESKNYVHCIAGDVQILPLPYHKSRPSEHFLVTFIDALSAGGAQFYLFQLTCRLQEAASQSQVLSSSELHSPASPPAAHGEWGSNGRILLFTHQLYPDNWGQRSKENRGSNWEKHEGSFAILHAGKGTYNISKLKEVWKISLIFTFL